MKDTEVSWCRSSFNLWWGCQRVSPGCQNCYAEKDSKRYGHAVWGPNAPRRFLSDRYWKEPLAWNAVARTSGERYLVFCSSMADVFEDRRDLDPWRQRFWDLVDATPALTWQVLTKRPENILSMVPTAWRDEWPDRVWIGASVEDQQRADERIPHLVQVPAAVRFLSVEPLLEPVVLRLGGIRWVIVGGESGGGARPFDPEWARSLIAQCRAESVAIFLKQLGSVWRRVVGAKDYKGADPAEWPEDLRVQEFPRTCAAPVAEDRRAS